jgi:hypothetical protein
MTYHKFYDKLWCKIDEWFDDYASNVDTTESLYPEDLTFDEWKVKFDKWLKNNYKEQEES